MKVKLSFHTKHWVGENNEHKAPKKTHGLIGYLPFNFFPKEGMMFTDEYLETVEGIDLEDKIESWEWLRLGWSVDYVNLSAHENKPILDIWLIGE